MNDSPWAIVLAAGDGIRLRSLTTGTDGCVVPKQFCSLDGGPTLFERALERAANVAGRRRVVPVVAEQHRALWSSAVRDLPASNLVVQPQNLGTAVGVLLPVLTVARRDPRARIVLFPSDHHVEHEALLQIAVLEAHAAVQRDRSRAVLLGMTPDRAAVDLGWILPAPGSTRLNRVERFVEKPPGSEAAELWGRGALWNSLILVAEVAVLLELFERRLPSLTATLCREVALGAGDHPAALARLYGRLPVRDFSREILQGGEPYLTVLEVPPCGWTDLGTPERVMECVATRPSPLPAAIHDHRLVLAETLRATPRKQAASTCGKPPPSCVWQG